MKPDPSMSTYFMISSIIAICSEFWVKLRPSWSSSRDSFPSPFASSSKNTAFKSRVSDVLVSCDVIKCNTAYCSLRSAWKVDKLFIAFNITFLLRLSLFNISNHGCYSAFAAVIRWSASLVSIFPIKSLASELTIPQSSGGKSYSPASTYFKTALSLFPLNGGYPLRIMYIMTPALHRSIFSVYESLIKISGAM